MQKRSSIKVAAALAAGALSLAACSSSSSGGGGGGLNNTSSSSSGGSGPSSVSIGFEGPLSGTNAQLGINEANGVRVAVAEANKSNTYGFQVKLITSDDQGDAAKSPQAANDLIENQSILGVVGPSFSGSTLAVGKIYSAANLAIVTPSATNATLQDQGFTSFHRVVPNDNVEGAQAADWLKRKGVKKLFVLQDQSTYGKGVGDTVAKQAKADGLTVIEQGLDGTQTKNYGPIAQTIKASGADALFYGGYDAQAALLAKALQSAGFTGLKIGGNGIKSSVFTDGAGGAGNGWFFSCGCQDATVAPAAQAFASAYQSMFKTPPSTYSSEAYDATNVLLTAIKDAGSTPTRTSVNAALAKIDFKGITTTIKFQSNGDLESSVQTVNLYTQKNGKIVEIGNIKDQG